jgi:hypothetical protein
MKKQPPSAGPDEVDTTASWWPELVELVDHLETEAARREKRPPRSSAEICAAIEREWWWRP